MEQWLKPTKLSSVEMQVPDLNFFKKRSYKIAMNEHLGNYLNIICIDFITLTLIWVWHVLCQIEKKHGLGLHSFNCGILNKKREWININPAVGHPLSNLKNFIDEKIFRQTGVYLEMWAECQSNY